MHLKKVLLWVIMLLLFSTAFTQTITVTGKITEDKNAAISDASVLEKDTKNGTVALSDGSFILKVKPRARLIIKASSFPSFLGWS